MGIPGDDVHERIDNAVELAIRYGQIDGEHHKTWVIDQVLRILLGADYDSTIRNSRREEDGPETCDEWDAGIAP